MIIKAKTISMILSSVWTITFILFTTICQAGFIDENINEKNNSSVEDDITLDPRVKQVEGLPPEGNYIRLETGLNTSGLPGSVPWISCSQYSGEVENPRTIYDTMDREIVAQAFRPT